MVERTITTYLKHGGGAEHRPRDHLSHFLPFLLLHWIKRKLKEQKKQSTFWIPSPLGAKVASSLVTFCSGDWRQDCNVTELMRFIRRGQSAEPQPRCDISLAADWSIRCQNPRRLNIKQKKRKLKFTENQTNTQPLINLQYPSIRRGSSGNIFKLFLFYIHPRSAHLNPYKLTEWTDKIIKSKSPSSYFRPSEHSN